QSSWLEGRNYIGMTAGTSTGDQTVNEVIAKLETIASD
ncbi:unnamed protein product, partial [marine sediment metagenome]